MGKLPIVSFLVVSIFFGILLGVHTRHETSLEESGAPERPHDLAVELMQLEEDYQNLLEEAKDLEIKLEKIEHGKWETYKALQDELKKVKLAAGVVPVTGKGVEVVMQSIDYMYDYEELSEQDVSYLPIYYTDILKLVNELYAAGAVAISINDQRLISTSEIRNAGDFIIVNSQRITQPYIIKAVGEPDRLVSALKIKGGLIEIFERLNIDVQAEPEEEIIMPAYKGIIDIRYAKPVKKEGNS